MRKLAWITVGFTYFLMVWGNLVSSTGSGLACPDWPLCHGTVTPQFSIAVMFEWGHRLLAFTTTVLIFATIFKVLRTPVGPIHRAGRSLIALLAIQILLGGTTVLLGLSIAVSTVHLIIANLVLSGLLSVASVVTWGNPVVSDATPKVRKLAVAGLGGLLVQLALGALVRHGHAGLACPNFPNCLDGFFPVPFTFETAIAFIHRWWGIALIGHFWILSRRAAQQSPSLARAARHVFAISIAQVLLGIGTVLSGLSTHARATHAAVGYALWAILFYTALRAGAFRWLWEKPSSAGEGTSSNPALRPNPA